MSPSNLKRTDNGELGDLLGPPFDDRDDLAIPPDLAQTGDREARREDRIEIVERLPERIPGREPGGSYDRPTMPTDCPAPVFRHVPYVHVADVEASLEFYGALGFETDSVFRDKKGTPCWASAVSGVDGRSAEVFFARADAPVVPEQQAVIFYMYSEDVEQLRSHLLRHGLHDGGSYRGQCGPNHGRCVVFEVSRPPYMTGGELRIADPDGYCILVGQLA